MPTYEYECTSCGQHIEVFQRFSEDPLTTCGNCGGSLRKVFHPAGIVFKGSGFYATDSRAKKASAPAAKKDADAGTSTAGAGSTPAASTGSSTASGDGGSTKKSSTGSEGS